MLDEYISDTCRQASARDNTLETTGTQFPSQESKFKYFNYSSLESSVKFCIGILNQERAYL